MIKTIETKRLLLLPYTLQLINATIQGHEQLKKVSGYNVSPHWPGQDFLQILPWAALQMEEQPRMAIWSRLIVLKAENIIIGEIGGKGEPSQTGVIEIGYSIVPPYQRNGYGTEAITTFTRWLGTLPYIKTVTAQCLSNNTPSRKVLEKASFYLIEEKEGIKYWMYKEGKK